LQGVREGDGTLLDRTVVMALQRVRLCQAAHAGKHSDLPGRRQGHRQLRTGLHVAAAGEPASRVGLTVQQCLGLSVNRLGRRLDAHRAAA